MYRQVWHRFLARHYAEEYMYVRASVTVERQAELITATCQCPPETFRIPTPAPIVTLAQSQLCVEQLSYLLVWDLLSFRPRSIAEITADIFQNFIGRQFVVWTESSLTILKTVGVNMPFGLRVQLSAPPLPVNHDWQLTVTIHGTAVTGHVTFLLPNIQRSRRRH